MTNEEEPQQGRIILFSVRKLTDSNAPSGSKKERRLEILCFTEVKGAVYSMVTIAERLLCSINHEVCVVNFFIVHICKTQL